MSLHAITSKTCNCPLRRHDRFQACNQCKTNCHKNRSPALQEINERYAADIFAPFQLTEGIDELSGVLIVADHTLEILHILNGSIWPAKFRLSLGYGKIEQLVEATTDSRKMSGSAFHLASNGIERGKKENVPLTLEFEDSIRPVAADAIETIAQLNQCLAEDWTAPTVKVFNFLMRTDAPTQSDIATRLNISQQAVSKLAKRSRFKESRNAQRTVAKLFNSLLP